MKRTIRNNDGFLLLEAVIYLALFLVFVGGVASSFYHLSFSDQDLSEEVLVIDEAEFVLKKINWLLSDTSKVLKPAPGETTEYLLIKDEFEKTTKIFLDNGLVVMEVDEEPRPPAAEAAARPGGALPDLTPPRPGKLAERGNARRGKCREARRPDARARARRHSTTQRGNAS